MKFISKNIKKIIYNDIMETIWKNKNNLICPLCKKNNIIDQELFIDSNFERKLSSVNTVCSQCGVNSLKFFFEKKLKGIRINKYNKSICKR